MFSSFPLCLCRLLLVLWTCASLLIAAAAETTTGTVACQLKVTDQQGTPISGAEVRVIGIRSDTQELPVADIDSTLFPASRTDGQGIAHIEWPVFPTTSPLTAVLWQIRKRRYVTHIQWGNWEQDFLAVTLERGRHVAVSATDARSGEPLQDHLFAMLSMFDGDGEWNRMHNGVLLSSGVALNRRRLRVVYLPPSGPPLFSRPLSLADRKDQPRVFLRNIQLHPGSRIEGRLDPQVPRPIHNGRVSLVVSSGRNNWQDTTGVAADGRFVFEAVPRDEPIQLTAICDGWVSGNPERQELTAVGMGTSVSRLQPSRVYPQVFRGDVEVLSPVLRMVAAASCEVTVVDAQEKPIPGATVRLRPWLGSYDGQAQLLGEGESTNRLLVESRRSGVLRRFRTALVQRGVRYDSSDRFAAISDEQGIARIETLPGGTSGSPAMVRVQVTHPDYTRRADDGLGDQGLTRAVLYEGRTSRLTMRLNQQSRQP